MKQTNVNYETNKCKKTGFGGLSAYPLAIAFLGKNAGDIAFYAYVVPFLVSTAVGAVLSALLMATLKRSGILKTVHAGLEV